MRLEWVGGRTSSTQEEAWAGSVFWVFGRSGMSIASVGRAAQNVCKMPRAFLGGGFSVNRACFSLILLCRVYSSISHHVQYSLLEYGTRATPSNAQCRQAGPIAQLIPPFDVTSCVLRASATSLVWLQSQITPSTLQNILTKVNCDELSYVTFGDQR